MMDLSFAENPQELRAFSFAIGVVVLSIASVVEFVFRGGIIFYGFAAATIAVFAGLAYSLSRPAEADAQPVAKPAGKAKRARKS